MIRKATVAALLALAPVAMAPSLGHAANVEIEAEGPVIELNITESIEAEPDIVTIGAGVSTEAPTAVEALRRNSEEMQRVIEAIKAQGVDGKDIQTTGIQLNARYDYDRQTRKNVFRGYEASNRVSATLREVETAGSALDALVVAGATNLSGPTFGIDDDTQPKAKARARALERGRERVAEYAAMLGYDGFKVLEISEAMYGRSAAAPPGLVMRAEAQVAAAPPPIEPGLVRTSVSLTLKFELVRNEDEG